MDNPFSAEGQNPFQTPYQAPLTPSGTGSSIKPFAAIDLAPAAGQRPNPGMQAAAPSPYLDGGFSNAFLGNKPAYGGAQAKPVDFSPGPAAVFPAPMTIPPVTQVVPPRAMHFPPAPAVPAAARQSQILALSDLNSPLKPGFFLTSTSSVEGFSIQDYLGLVSVEVVVPKDILFRNPAPHGELHRLKSAEEQLQRVKETTLEELSGRARALGADGIVGVTLRFSQFDTIVCLCSAVGTAVKLSG